MASRRRRRRGWEPDGDDVGSPRTREWPHEVDLHGCTVERAERRLLEELTRCRATGRSPVLVITGRGFGSHGGRGVLGPAIRRWLEGPAGSRVGVASVRRVRSGGALEVVLRRSDR